MLRKFPSWQAYSYIGCVVRFSGNAAVQGRVQVVGSDTVISYSMRSGLWCSPWPAAMSPGR